MAHKKQYTASEEAEFKKNCAFQMNPGLDFIYDFENVSKNVREFGSPSYI